MTSPSEEFETSANYETQYQNLMDWVAAEDASNGEVGCGWDLDKYLFAFLSTRGIVFDHEKLKSLLQEHLQDVLGEADYNDQYKSKSCRWSQSKLPDMVYSYTVELPSSHATKSASDCHCQISSVSARAC